MIVCVWLEFYVEFVDVFVFGFCCVDLFGDEWMCEDVYVIFGDVWFEFYVVG